MKGTDSNGRRRRIGERHVVHPVTIHEAGLPYPYVHYPGNKGTFICFSKEAGTSLYFCSCCTDVLKNAVRLDYEGGPIIGSSIVSSIPSRAIGTSLVHYHGAIERSLVEDALCHRCRNMVPTVLYDRITSSGEFRRRYGWYVNQHKLRLGVSPIVPRYLEDVVPEEVRKMIANLRRLSSHMSALIREGDSNVVADQYGNHVSELGDGLPYTNQASLKETEAALGRLGREYENYFENQVREEFGYRRIGDAWVRETMLYTLVSKIFPDSHIVRHHRPMWLGGLELDVHVIDACLAFEYQGIQHYEAIELWGGEQALQKQRVRDQNKRERCKMQGVSLYEVHYSDPLTTEFLKDLISRPPAVRNL